MAQFLTVKYQSQYHIMSTSYTSSKIAWRQCNRRAMMWSLTLPSARSHDGQPETERQ
jgi:hypothetical protein